MVALVRKNKRRNLGDRDGACLMLEKCRLGDQGQACNSSWGPFLVALPLALVYWGEASSWAFCGAPRVMLERKKFQARGHGVGEVQWWLGAAGERLGPVLVVQEWKALSSSSALLSEGQVLFCPFPLGLLVPAYVTGSRAISETREAPIRW